jgi:hypothetical protein
MIRVGLIIGDIPSRKFHYTRAFFSLFFPYHAIYQYWRLRHPSARFQLTAGPRVPIPLNCNIGATN